MGIHTLYLLILADLAMLNVGAAISATTAGRIPLKMRSTTGLYVNDVNQMAIVNIIKKEGKTAKEIESEIHTRLELPGAALKIKQVNFG